jgi:hypothetical protein
MTVVALVVVVIAAVAIFVTAAVIRHVVRSKINKND